MGPTLNARDQFQEVDGRWLDRNAQRLHTLTHSTKFPSNPPLSTDLQIAIQTDLSPFLPKPPKKKKNLKIANTMDNIDKGHNINIDIHK